MRRATGLVLLAALCGCHDWAPSGDVAGEALDAPDGDGVADVHDLPPDLVDRGDEEADAPDDAEGGADDGEADAPPDLADADDAVDAEVAPVCGNGLVEPGEDCELEQKVECFTDCGVLTTADCPDDCRAPGPADCPTSPEVCNGLDDDCNGAADDPRGLCPGCVVVERGGSVYHFCSALAWTAAGAACRSHGLHLVTVDDAAENADLSAVAATLAAGNWWMGFNDRATEGAWVWDGPAPASSYTNWGDGEPNDTDGNEDCGELMHLAQQWNDDNCAVLQPYVCEFP